jgi:hypothetical protein
VYVCAQLCIMLLFNAGRPYTTLQLVDALACSDRSAVEERARLTEEINAALLSLTAPRHAVLLASHAPVSCSLGLSGAGNTVLPFPPTTIFRVNPEFAPSQRVVQLHRVRPLDEEQSVADRTAMMEFRRQVIDAVVVRSIKGFGDVPVREVVDAVQNRLKDRFTATAAVRRASWLCRSGWCALMGAVRAACAALSLTRVVAWCDGVMWSLSLPGRRGPRRPADRPGHPRPRSGGGCVRRQRLKVHGEPRDGLEQRRSRRLRVQGR